jgi:DNA-directed RNA polymerase subunit RPC12/RpoP
MLQAGQRYPQFYTSPWEVAARCKASLIESGATELKDVECPECHWCGPCPIEWEIYVCAWCGLCFDITPELVVSPHA